VPASLATKDDIAENTKNLEIVELYANSSRRWPTWTWPGSMATTTLTPG
jgi:hypothetical protein